MPRSTHLVSPVTLGEDTTLQQRRTRKSHAKVRTGCITCKIRRKKCDETKPNCQRCTSTGRKCDGYEVHQPATAVATAINPSRSRLVNVSQPAHIGSLESYGTRALEPEASLNLVRMPPTVVCRAPSAITFGSEIDYHCFDFFRMHTAPRFASYFDSSVWRGTVMKLAFAHPMVLKATIAVGAVHRRFNYGISREAFEYCAIADRLQKTAMANFTKFVREEHTHPNYRQIVMLASMLFQLFEAFQGNYDKAVQHMTFGLNSLWSKPLLVVHSESRYLNYEIGPMLFHRLCEKLRDRATQLLGYRPRVLAPYEPDRSLPLLPPCFPSIRDAVEAIFTQADWIMHTPTRIWYSPRERRKFQRMHVSYILMWSAAYADMIQLQPELDSVQTQACMVVKYTRDVLYTLIYIIFCVQSRNNFDSQCLVPNELVMDIELDAVHHIHDPFIPVAKDKIQTHPEPNTPLSQPVLHNPQLWHHINSHPSLITKLTRLTLLVETLCTPTSVYTYTSNHSFSLDSGIGPPLSPDPHYEGSSKARHLVKSLLTRSPRPEPDSHPHIQHREDRHTNHNSAGDNDNDDDDDDDNLPWDTMGVYSVAERLSSIEEHSILRAIAGLGLDTDTANVNVIRAKGLATRAGVFRGSQNGDGDGNVQDTRGTDVGMTETQLTNAPGPNWIDITAFLEEGRLLVRYCQDDGLGSQGRGLVWVQEWLEF